jgi:hypothetical protein
MQRFHLLLFAIALLVLSWFCMMAVHELGHVLGAYVSGGTVSRVVLHPLTISRTDLSYNPHPGIVVWLGPLIGASLPLVIAYTIPHRFLFLQNVAIFFAGFCLVANGAYISVGVVNRVGDCDEMLRTGTPAWAMILFGICTVSIGLLLWHRLGSPAKLLRSPPLISPTMAYSLSAASIVLIVAEAMLSSP